MSAKVSCPVLRGGGGGNATSLPDRLYFYALTAHFGQWVNDAGSGKRVWQLAADFI
jgi:hypothetical protein